MVHSGSSSPMKTTPSVSPHLPVPVTAPPLPAPPPLVPPSADTREQSITQTPTKLTSNSDLTQLSTPTPADAETPVSSNSNPTSASTQTPTPAQAIVNGRTSGRKRTPKSCDCCGPNSAGHNVRIGSRGRGRVRGRGRGRGTGQDLLDTPRRKIVGLLTSIKKFDLTNDTLDGVGDGTIVSDTQSQTSVDLHISQQDGPITNCVSPDSGDEQMEEGLIDRSGAAGTGGSKCADSGDMKQRVLEMKGMGGQIVQGSRGVTGTTFASKIEAKNELKSTSGYGVVISSTTNALTRSVLVPKQGNSDSETQHIEQTDLSSVKAPCENGDIINLSENGPEDDEKDDSMTVTPSGNGPLSISELSGSASKSGIAQDLDSVMQADESPDRTDYASVSLSLSNGITAAPMDHDHETTSMEVEAPHPSADPILSHGPISVCSPDHPWALRDHRLYCHHGTWQMENMEKPSTMDRSEDTDDIMQNREQLIDMIHEFLESFYIKYGSFIPLSEADVVEYLKKRGNADLTDAGLDIGAEVSRYRAGLASAPVAGFMVTYNKHTLSLEDLGTLEEQNWLNDQIINMYGELIMDATQQKVHFFNSFFHKQLVAKGYDGVKRWTKKVDLFSKWLLLIPIHLEIHWSLVTVTMATKTINYYDSQGIVFRHTTDNIMKYLQSEAREKKQAAFQKGWKITIIKGIPQQKNDSDCGVFVLEYCRCLSVKQPLLFSQEDMPRIRKRIYKELCDCRLND